MRLLAIGILLAVLTGCNPSGQQSQLNEPAKASDSTSPPSGSAAPAPSAASPSAASQTAPANDGASVEEIADQSFQLELESWGKVRFVSAKRTNADGHKELLLSLKDAEGQTLYTFPQPKLVASWNFESVKAVSFKDVDGDGKKDVIVLADYITGKGSGGSAAVTAPSIFVQKEKSFVSDYETDNRLNASGKMTTVSDVVAFFKAKAKPDAVQTTPDSDSNATLEKVNRNLCSRVVVSNMSKDEIVQTYEDEYGKHELDRSERGQDEMYRYIGECFQQETDKLLANDSKLKTHTDAVHQTVNEAISELSNIDYIRDGGGTMWIHDGNRTIGLYGYRMNVYAKMKLNDPKSASKKYDSLAEKLDSNLAKLKEQGVKGLEELTDAQGVKEAEKDFDARFSKLNTALQKFKELTSDKDEASLYLMELLTKRVGASIDENRRS
ncbi:hypothetical protein [Paenibacillus tyrfis]|uniref:hypothetical protein n=1 Tax=Paenibacillus tyrfis TaxID=1501230 RepID=UPI0020A07CE0|nr:hypothetical protein [Paenibacillus tyrfis]MCP1308802.1 hypothetical protein [Paenibacillus tyrfis]